jgi:hypothetical protein
MFLSPTNSLEYFYNTVSAIAQSRPPISPFRRAYLMVAASRLAVLE